MLNAYTFFRFSSHVSVEWRFFGLSYQSTQRFCSGCYTHSKSHTRRYDVSTKFHAIAMDLHHPGAPQSIAFSTSQSATILILTRSGQAHSTTYGDAVCTALCLRLFQYNVSARLTLVDTSLTAGGIVATTSCFSSTCSTGCGCSWTAATSVLMADLLLVLCSVKGVVGGGCGALTAGAARAGGRSECAAVCLLFLGPSFGCQRHTWLVLVCQYPTRQVLSLASLVSKGTSTWQWTRAVHIVDASAA